MGQKRVRTLREMPIYKPPPLVETGSTDGMRELSNEEARALQNAVGTETLRETGLKRKWYVPKGSEGLVTLAQLLRKLNDYEKGPKARAKAFSLAAARVRA